MPTDPWSLTFISCFIIGLLFLLVTSFLGDFLHDMGHASGGDAHVGGDGHIGGDGHVGGDGHHGADGSHGDSEHNHHHGFSLLAIFNPMAFTFFLVGFGIVGFIIHSTTNLDLSFILIIASMSGIVLAFLIILALRRIFKSASGSTIQDVSDRTGLLGKVNMTIPENGLGEIIYDSPGGMRKSIPARTVDGRRLERGHEVVVISYQRGVAEVDTWDHFVSRDEEVSAVTQNTDDFATLRALLDEGSSSTQSQQYMTQKDMQKE